MRGQKPWAPLRQVQHIVAVLGRAVDIARIGRVKDVALDAVPRIIAEKSDAVIQSIQRTLVGRARAALNVRAAAHPGFAVHQDVLAAGQAVQRSADGVHCVHIFQRHQIKSETVNVVGRGPVQHRFHDVFAHHRTLAGQVAAAAGTVRRHAVGPAAVPVAGHGALQVALAVVGVVVDNIHHDAQPCAVQRGHHGAALPHTHLAVECVSGKAALGHVVVERVIAPVVAAVWAGLIHGGVVIDGLQLHMADAESL